MRELGVNFEALGGMCVDRVVRYDTVTLEKHFEEDYRDIETLCGAPYAAYHRGDLHNELWRLALLTEGSEIPVELLKGVKIVGIDTENATVELEDGTKYSGDLLIGADGLQSDVRAAALKTRVEPVDSNWQIYRFLLSLDKVMEDEALSTLKLANTRQVFYWGDEKTEMKRFIWYECRKYVSS